jgi:hypothetical protein
VNQTPVDIQPITIIFMHKFLRASSPVFMMVLRIFFVFQCMNTSVYFVLSSTPFVFSSPSRLLPYCFPIVCIWPSYHHVFPSSFFLLLRVKTVPSHPLSFLHPFRATLPFLPFCCTPLPSPLFIPSLSVSYQRCAGFSQSVAGTGYYIYADISVVLLSITSKFLIRGILFCIFAPSFWRWLSDLWGICAGLTAIALLPALAWTLHGKAVKHAARSLPCSALLNIGK